MPLVGDITLKEIREEEQRFDFLDGVRELVYKAMEFHSSDDNDAEYCFLFWIKEDDEHAFITRVRSNIQNLAEDALAYHEYGWNFDMNWNGTGLVFVRTFL
jgi:hypothetical protein